jgi:two-component system, NtrC family, response regulator AtoC
MKNVKILIVDDDANLALLIEARLKAADYDVRAATSAGEAFRTFLTFKPQLVLTDIGIGDENGLDLIKRIRSQDHNIKTIYMTGDLDRYRLELVKERKLHQAEVITKPFKTDELITVVAAQEHDHQNAVEARTQVY